MVGSLGEGAQDSWPRRSEELRADWLTARLREAGATQGVRVAEQVLDRDSTRGFASEVVRIHLRYDADESAAPKSLIAKFATSHPGMRRVALAANAYGREVRFYRELAGRVGLRVPRCHAAHFDASSGDFVLLLEDVEGVPTDVGQMSLERSSAILRELATFHAAFWNSPALVDYRTLWPSDEQQRKLVALFLEALASERAALGANCPNVLRTALAIAALLRDAPRAPKTRRSQVLVHGDLRPENLLFRGNDCDDFIVVDWQNVRVAQSGAPDVARLILTSLSAEQRRAAETQLLHVYHRTLTALGAGNVGFDEFLGQYHEAFYEQVVGYVILSAALRGDPEMRELIAVPMQRLDAALSDSTQRGHPFEQSLGAEAAR